MNNKTLKTILVVDDTPANIDLLLSAIGDYYEAAVALDGEEALSIASEEKPDLILLDVVMPGMDGLEVCRKLKQNPELSQIPVIFLSGNDSREEYKKGMEVGAVDYLSKPVDTVSLLEKLKQYTT